MNNIYNLATNFRSYQSLHHSKPLQRDLTNQSLNIFKTLELQRLTDKGFISSKNYEVVGVKQLRNSELRTRKGTKFSTRRQEAGHQRPISKQSQYNKNRLLTKQEVVSGLPKIDKPKKLVKISKNFRRKSQISQSNDLTMLSSKNKTSRIKNQFSVSRLKEMVRQRQIQWKKIINNERVKRENGKFPTIYKSIELYRSKVQEKQKNQTFDSSIFQKNSLWEKSLRKKGSSKQQHSQKSLQRIFHDDGQFSARGSSKLKLQTEWIQSMDKDGYQFKPIPSQKQYKQQRIQSFR